MENGGFRGGRNDWRAENGVIVAEIRANYGDVIAGN